MIRFHVEQQIASVVISVSSGGGVFDGQLLCYYECSHCSQPIRFIAVFEENQAELVYKFGGGDGSRLQLTKVGRSVVGYTGRQYHGSQRYNYGVYDGCVMVPFFGLPREFAGDVLDDLKRRGWGVLDRQALVGRRIDVTRLDGVELIEDRIKSGMGSLLMVDMKYLADPVSRVIGSLASQGYSSWLRKAQEAPEKFLQTITI